MSIHNYTLKFTRKLNPSTLMVYILISNWNGVKLKWGKIRIGNVNHNKLFTLAVGIEIIMNCITIDVFNLYWNQWIITN